MNRGIKKGTRMVCWIVQFGLRNFTWIEQVNPMTKQELKKFLREFNTSDWPQYDIISVKIIRRKRRGTTTMWNSETMGFTDVTPQGTLYDINL